MNSATALHLNPVEENIMGSPIMPHPTASTSAASAATSAAASAVILNAAVPKSDTSLPRAVSDPAFTPPSVSFTLSSRESGQFSGFNGSRGATVASMLALGVLISVGMLVTTVMGGAANAAARTDRESASWTPIPSLEVGDGVGEENPSIANQSEVRWAQSTTASSNATEASSLYLFVNPAQGSDGGSGSQTAPLRSLTHALALAQPGTTIVLAPGVYSAETGEQFPIRLKPGVVVQGRPDEHGQGVLIRGGGTFISPTAARQNITLLAVTQSSLIGITVINPNGRGYGVWVESSSPVLMRNTFRDSQHDGVSVNGDSTPLIQENLFFNNGANGVSVFGRSAPRIQQNVFSQTGYGINVADQAHPLVVSNRIVNNRSGVVVQEQASPTLRHNLIEGNQENGVVAIAQSQPDLGTPDHPGQNQFVQNGTADINAEVADFPVIAVGNQLNQTSLLGSVDITGTMPLAAGRRATPLPLESGTASLLPAASPAISPVASPVPSNSLSDAASTTLGQAGSTQAMTDPTVSIRPMPVEPESARQSASQPVTATPRSSIPVSRLPSPSLLDPAAPTQATASNPFPQPSLVNAEDRSQIQVGRRNALAIEEFMTPGGDATGSGRPIRGERGQGESSSLGLTAEAAAGLVREEESREARIPQRSPSIRLSESDATLTSATPPSDFADPSRDSTGVAQPLASALSPSTPAVISRLSGSSAASAAPVRRLDSTVSRSSAAASPVESAGPSEPSEPLETLEPSESAAIELRVIDPPASQPLSNVPRSPQLSLTSDPAVRETRSEAAQSEANSAAQNDSRREALLSLLPSRLPSQSSQSSQVSQSSGSGEEQEGIPLRVVMPSESTPNPQLMTITAAQSRPAESLSSTQPSVQSQPQAQSTPQPTIRPRQNLLPVPSADVPYGHVGNRPRISVGSNPITSRIAPGVNRTQMLGLRYRVLVEAHGRDAEATVRSIAPGAFRTQWNGRSLMQAGAYASLENANDMARQLARQGLRTEIQSMQ